MRVLSFAFFIGMMLLITVGAHHYMWTRLVRNPPWPAPWPTVGLYVLVGLAALLPITLLLHRIVPRWVATPLATVATAASVSGGIKDAEVKEVEIPSAQTARRPDDRSAGTGNDE